MMDLQLICVDIDGTLLDDDKRLLPSVKESLKNASEKGISIALVSGRMPAGVSMIENELDVPCIKVCNAGTYVLLGNECISARYLHPDIMLNIYTNVAEKYQIPLWIFWNEEWYVTEVDDLIEREMEIVQYRPKLVDVRSLAAEWAKEGISPNKVLLAAKPEKIQIIHKELQASSYPHMSMACSADTFIEIFPEGTDKGRALADICNKLNINIKNTMAIGDQELDIPMIETAGVGVAMGNAIAALKEKADFVTKTNNEAGVAYALKRYLAE